MPSEGWLRPGSYPRRGMASMKRLLRAFLSFLIWGSPVEDWLVAVFLGILLAWLAAQGI